MSLQGSHLVDELSYAANALAGGRSHPELEVQLIRRLEAPRYPAAPGSSPTLCSSAALCALLA